MSTTLASLGIVAPGASLGIVARGGESLKGLPVGQYGVVCQGCGAINERETFYARRPQGSGEPAATEEITPMGPSPPTVLWLVLGLTLLVAGVAGLVLAIAGRRVGTEPRCRSCRFDLTGIDLTGPHPTAPDVRCPECGAALIAGGVRTGVRRMRRWVLGGSLVLVLLGLIGTWHQTAWRLVSIPLRDRPFFWLAWDVRYETPAHADAAMAELWRRHQKDGMDFGRLLPLLDVVLDVHETAPDGRWSPTPGMRVQSSESYLAWQNVLYTAVRNGELSPQQLTRYHEQALTGVDRDWYADDRVRRIGRVEEIALQSPSPRRYRAEGWVVAVVVPTRMRLGGETVELDTRGFGRDDRRRYHASWHAIPGDGVAQMGSYSTFTSTTHPIPRAVLRELPAGTHTVVVDWRARVFLEPVGFDPEQVDADAVFGGEEPDLLLDLPATRTTIEVFAELTDAIELVDSSTPGARPTLVAIRQPAEGEPVVGIGPYGSAQVSLYRERRVIVGDPPRLVTQTDLNAGGWAGQPRYSAVRPEERELLGQEAWVVADLRLRIDGVLYPPEGEFQSTVVFRPGLDGHGSGELIPAQGIPADAAEAEVVLIPNPRHAAEFTDAERVWNEPIELGRVRIVREGEEGEEGE